MKLQTILIVLVGSIAVATLLIFLTIPRNNSTVSKKPDLPAISQTPESGATASAELKIEDIQEGTGPAVVSGNNVSVHYTGTLTNGQKFDSSLDRNKPFEFQVGAGQVIKGWDQGLVGMKVGGKRKLTIPPQLGYGNNPAGSIPANSTLVFEIELLAIK